MRKRILAIFLSACMALCLLPTAALAASTQAADPFLYAFDSPYGDIQLEIRASDDETVVELGEATNSIQLTQGQMDEYEAAGQVVYLRAIPEEGYGFAGWTGMLSWSMSPNPFCVTNLNRNNTYYMTATFHPLVTVTFDPGDHGRLADGEANSDTVVSDYWYDWLNFPELVVDDGYRFTGWRNSEDNEIYKSVADEVPASWDGAVLTAQYEEVSYQIKEIDVTIGAGLAEEMPNLMKCDILHAEYGGDYILLSGYNGHFTTPWIADYWHGIPNSLTSLVDTPAEAQDFFGGFTAMKTVPFWSTWKGWLDGGKIVDAYVSGTTLYLTLDTPRPASN